MISVAETVQSNITGRIADMKKVVEKAVVSSQNNMSSLLVNRTDELQLQLLNNSMLMKKEVQQAAYQIGNETAVGIGKVLADNENRMVNASDKIDQLNIRLNDSMARVDDNQKHYKTSVLTWLYQMANGIKYFSRNIKSQMNNSFSRSSRDSMQRFQSESEVLERVEKELATIKSEMMVTRNATSEVKEDSMKLTLEVLKIEVFAVPAAFILLVILVSLVVFLCVKKMQTATPTSPESFTRRTMDAGDFYNNL